MASVTLTSVSKVFDKRHVIKNVSISIGDGEFCVLVGPSGSGKSTLLRMIAGLEELTDGSLAIGEVDVTHSPPKNRDVAMVFQSYALYPQLTVRENMGFSLKLAKRPREEIIQIVNETALSLGLDQLLDRYPRELSGGQRQRVAMGRAIVRKPKVFLFDEPLSNLDAALRHQVRTEIRELYRRLKTTCVYVTHDQIEAMTLADRIVVLRDGHVEQIGTPTELYDRPKNRFVAEFIGSPAINLFAGTACIRNEETFIECAGGVMLKLVGTSNVTNGQTLLCGIRPEHLSLCDPVTENKFASISGTIRFSEFIGADSLFSCETPLGKILLTSRNRRAITQPPGGKVLLALQPDCIHVFDAESGVRVN